MLPLLSLRAAEVCVCVCAQLCPVVLRFWLLIVWFKLAACLTLISSRANVLLIV